MICAQKIIFAKDRRVLYNTIIGGVASIISTPAQLASKLNVVSSRIERFSIVGEDVYFHISTGFNIPTSAFATNNLIKSFIHTGGVLTSVGSFAFQNSTLQNFENNTFTTATSQRSFDNTSLLTRFKWVELGGIFQNYCFYNSGLTGVFVNDYLTEMVNNNFQNSLLTEIRMNALTAIGSTTTTSLGGNFYNAKNVTLISMRKLKTIRTTATGESSNFYLIKTGCIIEVNQTLLTSNNGALHPDLLFAKSSRQAVLKFYDDNNNLIQTL